MTTNPNDKIKSPNDGLTKREHFAIEILKSFMVREVVPMNAAGQAVAYADQLIKKLNER